MTPRIGSLFTGYGGLERAVSAVTGGQTTWCSDIDPGACKILAHHWPDVPNLGDISAVNWSQVEPVDILTGGFPCQDVSLAGRRAGMRSGTRSGLWFVMAEAINALRPALVVIENVRGLLSAEAHSDMEPCPWCVGDGSGIALRALGGVLGELADLGYDAAWHGLTAASVGAPHGRFRVFVIAWPTDADGPGLAKRGEQPARHERATAQRSDSHVAVTLLPTPTVSDTNGAGTHGDGGLDLRTAVTLFPTPRATRGASGTETMYALGAERNDSNRPQGEVLLPIPRAQNGETRNQTIWARPLDQPQNLENALAHAVTDWGQYRPAIERWENLTRPAPAATEAGPKIGQRLSPRFVEWMQGLPAGHVTDPAIGLTRNEQLKALGNGVVPQQAEAALGYLFAAVAA